MEFPKTSATATHFLANLSALSFWTNRPQFYTLRMNLVYSASLEPEKPIVTQRYLDKILNEQIDLVIFYS